MENIFLMTGAEIALAVVIPTVAVAVIDVIVVLVFKKKNRKLLEELKNDYNDYHETLTLNCYKSINRLKQLGKYSDKYKSLYEEKLAKYNDIISRRDRDTYRAIEEYGKTFRKKEDGKKFEGDRKDIRDRAVRVTNEYIRAVSSFNDELNSLLHEDTDTSDSSISTKAKYRKVREFYESHEHELAFVSRSYDIVISDAENVFAVFTDLTDQARYDEAKELLPKIDSILSALLQIQNDLPSLVAKVTEVIPQRIDEVENSYHGLINEDYKLSGDVKGEIAHMKEEVRDMQDKLKVLDVEGLDDRVDAIQQGITGLLSSFETEKMAKNEYGENKSKIGDSTYELEKKYSRYLNQISQYQEAYVLDQKYVEQMVNLKSEIENINALKRSLDYSITTDNVAEPYSVVNRKINEVLKGVTKANRIIDDYVTYTESLRDLSQSIYNNIRKYFLRLKEAESSVRNTKMCDYPSKVMPAIQRLYRELTEIDSILLKQPVDVTSATQRYQPFAKEADSLLLKIEEDMEEYQKAQYALMKAMAYKSDFGDSQPSIDMAEQAFRRSDFTSAYTTANNVVSTFSSLRNENV